MSFRAIRVFYNWDFGLLVCFIIEFTCITKHVINLFHLTFVLKLGTPRIDIHDRLIESFKIPFHLFAGYFLWCIFSIGTILNSSSRSRIIPQLGQSDLASYYFLPGLHWRMNRPISQIDYGQWASTRAGPVWRQWNPGLLIEQCVKVLKNLYLSTNSIHGLSKSVSISR